MNTNRWVLVLVALGALLTSAARAETPASELAPIRDAVELTLGFGYAQGFGDVSAHEPSLSELSFVGGTLQLGLAYRIRPPLALGVYGAGAKYSRGLEADHGSALYSAGVGLALDWHFAPAEHTLDPWVSLGSGFRGYWLNAPDGMTALRGVDLARLHAGMDFRTRRTLAIGQVFGIDLARFITASAPTSDGSHALAHARVNPFVFVGIQGRYDLTTRRGHGAQLAAR